MLKKEGEKIFANASSRDVAISHMLCLIHKAGG